MSDERLDKQWQETSYGQMNISSQVSDLYSLPDDRSAYVDDFSDGDLSNGGKFDKVLADAIASLLHAQHAAGQDATDVAREVMCAVADFWTEVGQSVDPPVNARLSCNLKGRLDAIERAAVAGDDAGARRELLALLKFFPR